MKAENVLVVPTTDFDSALRNDCQLITRLLQKFIREQPELTLTEAYAGLKWRVSRICEFDWESMEVIEID